MVGLKKDAEVNVRLRMFRPFVCPVRPRENDVTMLWQRFLILKDERFLIETGRARFGHGRMLQTANGSR